MGSILMDLCKTCIHLIRLMVRKFTTLKLAKLFILLSHHLS